MYKLATNGYDNADGSDVDGDGASAWQEYRADTNPTNLASVLRITAIDQSSGTLYFESSAKRDYTLLGSNSLVHDVWIGVPSQGPRAGIGGPDSMSDTNDAPHRFYQIRAQLP